MPLSTMDDGVRLHYEEAGSGVPVVFAHEMTGDARIWEQRSTEARHTEVWLPDDEARGMTA